MNKLLRRFTPFGGRVEVDGVWVDRWRTPLGLKARFRIARGGYEKAERDLVRQLVLPGDRVLECGASIGILSSILYKLVQPGGRVVSVEPNKELRSDFEHQIAINDMEVTLVDGLCCPIWREEVPDEWQAMGFSSDRSNLSGRVAEERDETPWHTLETISRAHGLDPTVLMIDVEGTERVWVEHPPRFPASVRVVIAEFHPQYIGATVAGAAVEAVLAEGFRVAGINKNVVAFER